jgi:two-component system nitrate/nitrite sensor histidine kinase NarX
VAQTSSTHEPQAPRSGGELLAQIAAGLAEGRDLRTLLDRFLEPVVALAGAQAGAVRLLSESGERLQLVGDVGLPADVHRCEASVDVHCGDCGRAIDSVAAVWSDDLAGCATHGGQNYFGGTCRRMLAVPLQHRGRVLGLYNLFFDTADGTPSEPVRQLLRSVGELLGLALHNARLEAEILRRSLQQERQAMAAEVHDSIAQTLTFVNMRLPLLEDALSERDGVRARRYIDDLRRAVGEAHGSLRQIVAHYRTQIGPRGLLYAIDALIARLRERSGIELIHAKLLAGPRLSEDAETEVFHIVQEALTNIERHSRARRAWISVEASPDGGLELCIEDDGIGPHVADEQCDDDAGHFGLSIMRERAHRIGGVLAFGRREGGGTRVRLSCPASVEDR